MAGIALVAAMALAADSQAETSSNRAADDAWEFKGVSHP
jgi:hypothetical protein